MSRLSLFRPLFVLVLALLLPLSLHAAQAPDWLAPLLKPEVLSWSKRPVVVLLNQTELRYTSVATSIQRNRGAMQFNEQKQNAARPSLPLAYRGNTDKILHLRVWSISPDGKVKTIPRSALSERASTSRMIRHASYTVSYDVDELPAGSIIAWDFEMEHSTGPLETLGWHALRKFPVYQACFKALPPADGVLRWHRSGPNVGVFEDKGAEGLSWRLEKLKVPAGERPSGFIAEQNHLALRCLPKTGLHANTDTWEGLAKADYELVAEQQTPTPEIKAMAEKLVAGKTERWSRIRALTDFVQGEISYLSQSRETDYLAGFRPQTAAECLKNRMGDCKDKAVLFSALMQSIGEEAHVVLLFGTDPAHVRADFPSNTFNHAISAIPAGADAPAVYPIADHPRFGRLVIVDTTALAGELGILPIADQLGHALLCHPTLGGLFKLPTDTPSTLRQYRTNIRLDANGMAAIDRVETNAGQPGVLEYHWRDKVAVDKLRSTLEARYSSTGIAPRKLDFSETWDPVNLRHVLTVKFEVEQVLRKASKELWMLSPTLTQPPPALAPWRTEAPGVSMQPYLAIDEEISIELPPKHSVDTLPAPEQARSSVANYSSTVEQHEGRLLLRHHYEQQAGLYSKEDYNAARELRQRWITALRRPLVLKSAQ